MTHLREGISKLDGLEQLCPNLIDRWDAPPWKGFLIPHGDFSLGHRITGQTIVVMILVTLCSPSKSFLVCSGCERCIIPLTSRTLWFSLFGV